MFGPITKGGTTLDLGQLCILSPSGMHLPRPQAPVTSCCQKGERHTPTPRPPPSAMLLPRPQAHAWSFGGHPRECGCPNSLAAGSMHVRVHVHVLSSGHAYMHASGRLGSPHGDPHALATSVTPRAWSRPGPFPPPISAPTCRIRPSLPLLAPSHFSTVYCTCLNVEIHALLPAPNHLNVAVTWP